MTMTLNEYHYLAMRTDSQYKNCRDRLLNGLMGLNGEAGEAIDVAKKHLFQGHDLDYDKLAEELGDNLWYIVLCADAMDMTLEDIARRNIEKLKIRFPDGFSEQASIDRVDMNNPLFRLKDAVMEELK